MPNKINPVQNVDSSSSALPNWPPDVFESDGDIIDMLESMAEEDDKLTLFTQHLATSPPKVHSSFKPKSVFYPAQSKGPYLESFYRVVYADFVKLCQSSSTIPIHKLTWLHSRRG